MADPAPSSDALLAELVNAGEMMAKMIRALSRSTPPQISESMAMAETAIARWSAAIQAVKDAEIKDSLGQLGRGYDKDDGAMMRPTSSWRSLIRTVE